MNRIMQSGFALALVLMLATGCSHLAGKCDLAKVANDSQLQNVTTGDGTFENYKTTGYYTGTEIGLGVGIPLIVTLLELFPSQDDTAQMTQLAKDAKRDDAQALINAKTPSSIFTGFPLFFIGLYVDSASGTGIKGK